MRENGAISDRSLVQQRSGLATLFNRRLVTAGFEILGTARLLVSRERRKQETLLETGREEGGGSGNKVLTTTSLRVTKPKPDETNPVQYL